MSKLIPLTLVLVPVVASLFAVLACSGDDPTPVSQPTATRVPDAAVRPTATPQPTATSTPQVDRSESAQGEQPSRTQGLAPVNMDDPEAFLSALSPQEQSCLGGRDIGARELLQMTGRAPGGSPETAAAIIRCLQDDTVLRLFLTTLVGQVAPFSQETSTCIREGFVQMDLRGIMAPAGSGFTPADSMALSMAALNISVVCMNDVEWETYAPRLGMQPEDRDGAACLFEELGGPAKLVKAMQEAISGEVPVELTRAFETCESEGASSSP